MNDISSRHRNVIIPTRLFVSFTGHVQWEIDRNVEVMGIWFGKDYEEDQKVNRIIIPYQEEKQ